MAAAALTVTPGSVIQDNSQRLVKYTGLLQLNAFDATYQVGGIPLAAVLAAALLPTGTLKYVLLQSTKGSGYIYQFIEANGTMMVLEVPVNGSLTTSSPLTQLKSSALSLSGVFEDTIRFEAYYLRNS